MSNVAIVLGVCLMTVGAPVDVVVQHTSISVSSQSREASQMDASEFWGIVDRTLPLQSDPERQLAALEVELSALSADDVVAFQTEFDRQLAIAYRWDLWAVAYIAHGGASDDGFEYFRRWLVSKGRSVFERVLANPDELAAVVETAAPGLDGVLEFEDFHAVGWYVWAGKTGREPNEIPVPFDNSTLGNAPEGDAFSEDPAELARRFPKTWARFGESPLQGW